MAKKENKVEPPLEKWEVIYKSEDQVNIWRYDIKISRFNPVEIEILYLDDKNDARKVSNLMNKK